MKTDEPLWHMAAGINLKPILLSDGVLMSKSTECMSLFIWSSREGENNLSWEKNQKSHHHLWVEGRRLTVKGLYGTGGMVTFSRLICLGCIGVCIWQNSEQFTVCEIYLKTVSYKPALNSVQWCPWWGIQTGNVLLPLALWCTKTKVDWQVDRDGQMES